MSAAATPAASGNPQPPRWSAGVSQGPFSSAPNPHRFGFHSRRSPVISRHGSVACSQPLAAQVGLRLLERGANAAEACVAVAAALNVLEPGSTGLGGDCFAIYFDARTGRVEGLNGSGRSPQALSQDKLRPQDRNSAGDALHPLSVHTVTVPGAARGWADTVSKWGTGKFSLAELLRPAREMAEEGVPVAPLTAEHWARNEPLLLQQNGLPCVLLPNGHAPPAGSIYRNPDLAETLRVLGEDGVDAFYSGRIGQAIVECTRARGGFMTLDDLTSHVSTFPEPVSVTYKGVQVFEIPPNGQGITALLALNMLAELEKMAAGEGNGPAPATATSAGASGAASTSSATTTPSPSAPVAPLASLGHNSAAYLHRVIEVMRLAFADTRYYVCDPDHADADRPLSGGASAKQSLAALLSPAYARARIQRLDHNATQLNHPFGSPTSHSSTVSFAAVDREGNACSFINSNYMGFGTGIVVPGCGITLQNRGAGFTLDPVRPGGSQHGGAHQQHPSSTPTSSSASVVTSGAASSASTVTATAATSGDPLDSTTSNPLPLDLHANGLAGGKKPFHTIIPGLALRDGKLWGPFSVMGGFNQPQGHVQLLLNMCEFGMDPQAACDAPRFCIESGTAGGTVLREEGGGDTGEGFGRGVGWATGEDVAAQLAAMGHPVRRVGGYERIVFGRAQVIRRMEDGTLWAGSDGRADGCAVGY